MDELLVSLIQHNILVHRFLLYAWVLGHVHHLPKHQLRLNSYMLNFMMIHTKWAPVSRPENNTLVERWNAGGIRHDVIISRWYFMLCLNVYWKCVRVHMTKEC